MDQHDGLLERIERYIAAANLNPTLFGKLAANDPTLVFDMRGGRELRRKTRQRILEYIERNPTKAA
jgi:hypothetical protein